MLDFNSFPNYDRYRTLRLTTPMMSGQDVYALQTGLLALGFDPLGSDGVLGNNTVKAIKACQSAHNLEVDGWAGGRTQEAIGFNLSNRTQVQYNIAFGLMRGQLEHESSWRLGNYSERRPDTSYDAGVAQRNTAHAEPRDCFDVPDSINTLGFSTIAHWKLFAGISDIKRRWALAAGAWNAPAYACYIARQEGATKVSPNQTAKPGPTARAALEAYIQSVITYLVV